MNENRDGRADGLTPERSTARAENNADVARVLNLEAPGVPARCERCGKTYPRSAGLSGLGPDWCDACLLFPEPARLTLVPEPASATLARLAVQMDEAAELLRAIARDLGPADQADLLRSIKRRLAVCDCGAGRYEGGVCVGCGGLEGGR